MLGSSQSVGSVLAERDLEDHDGRHLARDDAHAQVELLGEVGVGVEQVAVRGLRAQPLPHGALLACGDPCSCRCDGMRAGHLLTRRKRLAGLVRARNPR